MGNIIKHLFWIAPVTILILYFALHGQEKVHQEIRQENAVFERDWNEAQAGFAKTKEEKKGYLARTNAANEEIQKVKKEREAAEAEDDARVKDFDESMKEIDRDLGRGK
jgi:hypothetical protein